MPVQVQIMTINHPEQIPVLSQTTCHASPAGAEKPFTFLIEKL
jgi:hypothetical protein